MDNNEQIEPVANQNKISNAPKRRSRGRPKGSKNKKIKMVELTQNYTGEASEIGATVAAADRWRKMGRQKGASKMTDEELQERVDEYFEYCALNNEFPTKPSLANALGVTSRAVSYWQTGGRGSPKRREIIESAMLAIEAIALDRTLNGKIHPTTFIFMAKNNFGWRDQTDVVLTPNNPLGDVASEKELLEKYRDMIGSDVVVIDAKVEPVEDAKDKPDGESTR